MYLHLYLLQKSIIEFAQKYVTRSICSLYASITASCISKFTKNEIEYIFGLLSMLVPGWSTIRVWFWDKWVTILFIYLLSAFLFRFLHMFYLIQDISGLFYMFVPSWVTIRLCFGIDRLTLIDILIDCLIDWFIVYNLHNIQLSVYIFLITTKAAQYC